MSAIRELLDAHGVLGTFRQRGHRLFGPCPVHEGDNPRAFVVDLPGDRWYCFTGCRRGGGPRTLARVLRLPAPTTAVVAVRERRPFQAYTRRLRLHHRGPWLAAKGIEEATARRWEVGVWEGRGMVSGCVALRLHDMAGQPLGYMGRRLDPAVASVRGKWVFPPRLPKSQLLYGLHRVQSRSVVVTECPWGVLRLAQIGIAAVGLLGVGLSSTQLKCLRGFEQVIALMDGDAAGRAASHDLEQRLGASVAELPAGLDPDDLTDDALRATLFPFLMH